MSSQEECFREKFSRRDFLKIAIASGSVVAFAGLVKLFGSEFIDSALATPGAGPYYYGTDTSWAVDTRGSNASGFPQNFYIGRTGIGDQLFTWYDATFNSDAAIEAGFYYTHTYWDVKGPYYPFKGSRTNYQYGYDQGTLAASGYFDSYNKDYIGGRTVFADIEEEPNYNDGWRDSNGGIHIAENRDVLVGFFDGIVNYTRNGYNPGMNPGVYTRKDIWLNWFGGTSYNPGRAYVVWLAGDACELSCSPCGICTTAKSEADGLFESEKETVFGKYKTVIWQFYVNSCTSPTCADYDIARQNGYIRFAPITAIYLPLIMKNTVQAGGMNPKDSPKAYPPPYP